MNLHICTMSGCKQDWCKEVRVYVVDFTDAWLAWLHTSCMASIAKKSSQEDIWSTMIMDLPCLWFDEHIPVVSFQGGCFVVFSSFPEAQSALHLPVRPQRNGLNVGNR